MRAPLKSLTRRITWLLLAALLLPAMGAAAIGGDRKSAWSIGAYAAAIVVAGWAPWLACALYAAVAACWFIPDRRIERNAA